MKLPEYLERNFRNVEGVITEKVEEKVAELQKIVRLRRKGIEGWIYSAVY